MARAKIEIGLTVSYLVDIDHECDDSDDLDGVVDLTERDDGPEIMATMVGVLTDDPRYVGLCNEIHVALAKVRTRYPDTIFEASLYPIHGLAEPEAI
ncbi:MAG: hypothetical protein GY851_09240 [bacterium]|nr:hypothetical protein [bacterium]